MIKKKPPPEYNIGIIGCGKTGKDLFEFLTGFRFHVTLVCRTDEAVEKLANTFRKKQNRALKYRLTDPGTYNFRNQNTIITSDLNLLKNCHLVIEAISENADRKKELFRQIEPVVSPDCMLASNTSSIPPDELFKELKMPGRCLGLHFFFPVTMKNFVEINVAVKTGNKTVLKVEDFLKSIKKNFLVLTGNDHFIINRMFLKVQAGCCQLLQEGILDVSEIDALVKDRLFPAGIFNFFDQVGNDVMLQSVKNYLRYENDPGFFLPLIECLEEKVGEGRLGKKTKSGFYDYPLKTSSNETVSFNEPEIKNVLQKITGWCLDGIFDVLYRSVCSKSELEQIVKEYLMVEKSPFELAGEIGYVSK